MFPEMRAISVVLTHPLSHPAGLKLMGAPVKMTVSQGQPVKLNCSVEGMEDPDIHWMKDGTVVQNASQVSISISEHSWIGLLRCRSAGREREDWPVPEALLMSRGLWS
jgi:TYRO3 protein tyrosine kinase 3